MRNLELLHSVHLTDLQKLKGVQCSCVDYDTGIIYCATHSETVGLNPNDGQITGSFSLIDDGYLSPDGNGKVVGIAYLAEQQSVCLATSSGDLILWNVLMGQVECVGTVDSGITHVSWSPDDALLVLTTGQNTLIVMTHEFDPIAEKPLESDEFGSGQFVTVGWGKKETQFHGSAGKHAAQVKPEDVKPALPWDDRAPRISWRGDGQFFVISTVASNTGARKLRIWSRDVELQATSENVDGAEHPLAWRPSGNLVASTQRKPNKHEVVFYEKNGLRHGEFTLPSGVKDTLVKELLWNNDSSVLCVWCEDLAEEEIQGKTIHSFIQLWTTSNYHWYLKQTLHFDSGLEDRVVSVVWDPEHAHRLHIICEGGKYHQYTWSWTTHVSQEALVAVLDGSSILMTPLDKMVVPPPMSSYRVQCDGVSQITFCHHGNRNDFACLLRNGKVAFYKFDKGEMEKDRDLTVTLDGAGGGMFGVCCNTPYLFKTLSIEGLPHNVLQNPLSLSHMTWLNSESLVFVYQDATEGQNSTLCTSKIEEDHISILSQMPLEGYVYQTAVNDKTGIMAVQLSDGTVLKLDSVSDTVLPWEMADGQEVCFTIPCQQMAVCDIGGEDVVLGLTNRYRFYVNNTEIASNCTSFAVHSEFLLLTTLTHTIRCISRHTKVNVLPTLSDGKAHPFDESIRRVERGSRIVTVVPDDTKLILQMPRGNLETIHPRALILCAVRKHLDSLEFSLAMTLMRKHRINMNLIYDHNPERFLQNVDDFVCQINNVNFLNLFLSDLQEEDVTQTMYTAAYNKKPCDSVSGDNTPSKIDRICDAIRKSLITYDEEKFVLTILTTYVKKSSPELEAALLLVRSMRDTANNVQHLVSPQEALKYLLFLVDVNEMFDVALGTYDFDLVLMVAEKSQKDPKEYIPFLNSLRRLHGPYQKYTIDKHLKRHRKALFNISQCVDHFQECLELVIEHRLYTDALDLFPASSNMYTEIAKSYGEYLMERKKYDEAGIMYICSKNFDLALKSFTSSGNWQQVFCMASHLKYDEDNTRDLARKISGQLKDSRRYREAAVVLEQYAEDSEEAIVCLIEGALWSEALRLMYKHNRTDFIETNLKTALIDSHDQQMETIQLMQEEFDKHRKRLKVVREEAEKARLEFQESGGLHNDADLFSDTSSADGESVQSSQYSSSSRQSTVYSKSSGRSSKNRRKAEHKKWKLKEGSKYEDFALIAAMSKTVTNAENMKVEISELLHALVQFHYRKQATTLQNLFDRFLSQIETSIPEIWTDEAETRILPMSFGPGATANSIAQAMQSGQSFPMQEKLDPIIKNPPVLKKEVKWKLRMLETYDT